MSDAPDGVRLLQEVRKCRRSPHYFLDAHCQVYDAHSGGWVPFRLWPAQLDVLDVFRDRQLAVVLKARQLGFSWLALGYALWVLLFRPAATVLVFSKRDDEAVDLLDFRLKGMAARLPWWLRPARARADDKHQWLLPSGSRALAFPTTGGRSYTGSLVLVDEADYVPDLNGLLNAVKPTVDAGGKLLLLSTADKSRPQSTFKRIYRAARAGENGYAAVFHGWRARPDRTDAWYEAQRADVFARTGSLDDLHQEYPGADAEALSPRTLDKRIAPAWLEACYREARPLSPPPEGAPPLPGLEIYRPPQPGRLYVISADPAEGNPTSDDSAASALDVLTGEEVAVLAGKLQPSALAAAVDQVGRWYNDAPVLCERNNHGHAVLLWLAANSPLILLDGHDGKPGWLSSAKGKALLYDAAADACRHGETVIHSLATFAQLASIDGSTLRAPEGENDDRADAHALGLVACARVAAAGRRAGLLEPGPARSLPSFP